jgi:glycerate kinase
LRAFAEARLHSGFELFAAYSHLEERIRNADVVVSGEGALDQSSFMGKGVGEIARLCQKHGVPCLMLAGTLGDGLLEEETIASGVEAVVNGIPFRGYGIVPRVVSLEESGKASAKWLQYLARHAAARACPA